LIVLEQKEKAIYHFASILMIYTKKQNRNKKIVFIALYWLAITTN